MLTVDTQAMPDNYFNIDVAGLASFVISAADEDLAYIRLREYCKENSFLNIDPDSHFDIFNKIQTVSDKDANFYRKTQIGQNIVRLMGYTETNVSDYVFDISREHRYKSPAQLELFAD